LVGILLFVSGFLMGIAYRPSAETASLAAAAPPPATTATPPTSPVPKPAEQPAEATADAGQTPQSILTPVLATPPEGEEEEPGTEAAEAATPPESPGAAPPPAPAPAKPSPPPAAATPVAAAPAAAPNPAPSATASAETPPAPSSEDGYALQVGSFLDPDNAARLAKQLQDKGYKATIFNAMDSHYRVWHAVRIGPFKDMQTAAKEAATILNAEQLLALVRPAKSL